MSGGAVDEAVPATPLRARKPFLERKTREAWQPSRWSGRGETRSSGVYRTIGLHFHLAHPRPVWVTSLNGLTGIGAAGLRQVELANVGSRSVHFHNEQM